MGAGAAPRAPRSVGDLRASSASSVGNTSSTSSVGAPAAGDFLVQGRVGRGRTVPAVVGAERVAHQLFPDRFFLEITQAALDREEQLVGVEVREGQAVAGPDVLFKIRDGVLEAADLADDGHRAVFHGDHLAQAAGLVARRHEEQVGAGVDLVGQFLAEADLDGHFVGVAPRQVLQGLFISAVARADHDELDIFLHHLVHDEGHQIQALGLDEARNHGQDRDLPVDGQAQFLLEGHLIQGLAGEKIRLRVRIGDVGVRGGVVDRVVHAIQDARQFARAKAHVVFQALAEVGVPDFLGVSRAHGRNGVCIVHARLEEIDAPAVFDVAVVIQPQGQAQDILHQVAAVNPLVLQVVNREDVFQGRVVRVLLELFL